MTAFMPFLRKLSVRVVFLLLLSAGPLCASAYFDTGEAGGEAAYIPSILIVRSDEEAAELESRGVVIWHRRADMALCVVPADRGESVLRSAAGAPGARGDFSSAPRRAVPVMDVAKTHFNASAIHSGDGLPQPYTGRGVIAGFVDIGFDPHHINFLDADGSSRVRRLIFYNEPAGVRRIVDSPEEIAVWTTDHIDETHATHVAGIMAGSYNANGYGGMAPGAEIVAATSELYDAGILSACEDIIEYAKSVGKPAVINLSLGSYNGPHDGSTLFNRYMDLLAEEAVICMASGNEGVMKSTFRTTFSETSGTWRTLVFNSEGSQFRMQGLTDIWSADSRPVSVRLHIYDEVTRTSVWQSASFTPGEGQEMLVTTDSDPALAAFLSGALRIAGGVSDLNGRCVTTVEYDTQTSEPNPSSDGRWARYCIGLEISGEPGVHADVTADCQYSRLAKWPGYAAPTSDLSVSDIATGHNVVCVGMYNSRDEIPEIGGSFRPAPYGSMVIYPASGYGTLIDGRVLPHSVAPGGCIVSSTNSHYAEAHPELISTFCAEETVGGKNYYWNVNTGTSMSTPYLAGTVATWLEAMPSLTGEDVREILAETNATDCYDAADPRNGNGWLRPYEGLKKALARADVSVPVVGAAEPAVVIRGDVAEILNPSGGELSVSVVSLSGVMAIPSLTVSGTVATVDLSGLQRGVYAISVSSDRQKGISRKFVR